MEEVYKEYIVKDIRSIDSLFSLQNQIFFIEKLELIQLYVCLQENNETNAYLISSDTDLDHLREMLVKKDNQAKFLFKHKPIFDYKILEETGMTLGSDFKIGSTLQRE